ncbi:sugar phosphate isomerase/epimerase family protein [Marinicrinis lubricantis]|uniref:Sugar phosphate isomerase/epimerase family protein n=1 Tax=Marinicrinis lubricantis TaxID=2086470 RepID=A0ABW1IPC3_9BACL
MKIASFSGAMINYSMHEAMEITKRAGLDGIEIACREPHLSAETSYERVREMKRLAMDLGLQIPALAGYMGNFSTSSDAECEKAYHEFVHMLEWADLLEAELIRIFQGGPNAFLAEAYHYEKAAWWLNRCAIAAKKHDKKIVLEIHNNSLVETADTALKLLGMIGQENVGVIHDAANMYITDTDYGRDSVFKLRGRLFHVHVKDEMRIDQAGAPGTFVNRTRHGEEHFLQCRLGEGAVDHQPLLTVLQEIGYGGWITLECFAPYPAEDNLVHDLQAVRSMLMNTRKEEIR